MSDSTTLRGRRWWRQPLLHFAMIGLALFALWEWAGSRPRGDDRTVVVDRDALLTYMQYRATLFDPDRSTDMLDGLGQSELDQLIDDYVREEVLFREAKALGLDGNDFIIRQRLVQKLEFINRDLSTALTELSDDEVRGYFEAHREDYVEEPLITFTHVFFNDEGEGRSRARERAAQAKPELNTRRVPFGQGAGHGDPFNYNVNYLQRSREEVASHFGREFAETVFELEVRDGLWAGPIESAYGVHLVMITERTAGRQLELDEIQDVVRTDARRVSIEERDRAILDGIVATYDVEIRLEPNQQ